ncbi:MAG: hypothetical protein FWE16_00435 [Firmicutes bacterium]|nr:hypothetical protein [Bacillota bacterium]
MNKANNFAAKYLLSLLPKFKEVDKNISKYTIRTSASADTKFARGWMHVLEHDNAGAILLSFDLKTYRVSKLLVLTKRLEMGDLVDAYVADNEVKEITLINGQNANTFERRNTFDKKQTNQPDIIVNLWKDKISLGSRVIVSCDKTFNRVKAIAESTQNSFLFKIALLIDEQDNSVKFLTENKIDEVYMNVSSLNSKEQLALCLQAFFSAKYHASNNKNVIFFVDNLSKIFKIYNKCACGETTMGQMNESAVNDLKHMFLSAKQFADDGSLTIVKFINKPTNYRDEFLYEEFTDIANKIIEM